MSIDLVLSGFQSIRNPVCLTLEGLTVIEGESNIGKSALIRLVHAAFSNKAGTYYITTGEEKASLEWRDVSNHLIWEKHGSSVSYLVNNKRLNKPGRGTVPDEVSRVGVCEIRTSDKHKYWPQIQFQGEMPFVISERSPAIAAELLGSSKDLLKVARALRLVRADISQDGVKLRTLEEQSKLISDRTRLLENAYTSSSQVYQDVEASFNIQVVSQQKLDTLTGLSDHLDRMKVKAGVFAQVKKIALPDSPDIRQVQSLSGVLSRHLRVQYVLRASRNLVPLGTASDQITDRFVKLHALYQKAQILSRKIGCLKTVAEDGVGPKPEIQGLYQKYERLQKLKDQYISSTHSKTAIDNSLIDINKKLKALDHESKQLKSLVQDLNSCPFCEAPLHEGKYCPSVNVS
jgi:hypothetical protein